MIVHSNAFVYSTCLLVVDSRYGFNYLFFQHIFHLKKMLYLKVIRFSHRHNLQIINLEAVTFINTISLRRGQPIGLPLSLLISALSLGLYYFSYKEKIVYIPYVPLPCKHKRSSTFVPADKVSVYYFRSVKF